MHRRAGKKATVYTEPLPQHLEAIRLMTRDSGMLTTVVQRSATAILTTNLYAVVHIRCVFRVIIIMKRFPINEMAIIISTLLYPSKHVFLTKQSGTFLCKFNLIVLFFKSVLRKDTTVFHFN